MLSCPLVQLAVHLDDICSWFSVRILAVENLALVPNMLSRVPDVYWFRVVKNTFVTAGSPIVEPGLLGLLLEVGFLVSSIARVS